MLLLAAERACLIHSSHVCLGEGRTKGVSSGREGGGSQGGIGVQAGFCGAEDAEHGPWMLAHLAKVAIMFGLRSSGGSYEKMRSEYYLDAENPFCPQV